MPGKRKPKKNMNAYKEEHGRSIDAKLRRQAYRIKKGWATLSAQRGPTQEVPVAVSKETALKRTLDPPGEGGNSLLIQTKTNMQNDVLSCSSSLSKGQAGPSPREVTTNSSLSRGGTSSKDGCDLRRKDRFPENLSGKYFQPSNVV